MKMLKNSGACVKMRAELKLVKNAINNHDCKSSKKEEQGSERRVKTGGFIGMLGQYLIEDDRYGDDVQ
ncbi:hypothetical protein [Thermococcus cleftensis]|uniref:hypothetical protein n=1 Tax=Thermococcus cleftensis (strain DSM 27260 / KACC 17922 / CL1) TaxID=163003 RepID=UPI0011D2946D|nr:hypothetical protein [Thermococcus cleftensis]